MSSATGKSLAGQPNPNLFTGKQTNEQTNQKTKPYIFEKRTVERE